MPHQGAGDRDTLLQPAGQLGRQVVGAIGKAYGVQDVPARRFSSALGMLVSAHSGSITFSRAVTAGSRWWNWSTKSSAPPRVR